jgi:archaellum component FlaF (FlaF/FlaG flagellin family)
MKQLGLIIISLILAMGTLGIAQAMWYDKVDYTANFNFAHVSAVFHQAVSNDTSPTTNDPNSQGIWNNWTAPALLTQAAWTGGTYSTTTTAWTTVSGQDPDSSALAITVNGGYAGYWSSVGLTILNNGSLPVTVSGISVTWTGIPTGGTANDIAVQFSGVLNAASPQQIEPGSEVLGGIYFHWIQVAPTPLSTYNVVVSIKLTQFNTASDPAKTDSWAQTLTISGVLVRN